MIRFECDYGEGAHPKILEALARTNYEQTPGYGRDIYCDRARKLISELCCSDDVDVHFLVGGTQTNTTLISAALRTHQGVISASTGHIGVHETGAIEATGHKVLTITSNDGKIYAEQIDALCNSHYCDSDREHTVQPGMVYLSNPTENGTIYSLDELTSIKEVCEKYSLLLYVDGARLGYGLESSKNTLSLKTLTELCDAFYIGGTKQGMLFGEALVIKNETLKKDFRYIIKQHGGMLAKGRLLGIQYCVMFEDGLYFELSRRAVCLAMKLRDAFEAKGYKMYYDSYTNQQFPIIDNATLDKLKREFSFSHWADVDEGHAAVRFCTSWATTDEQVSALTEFIQNL
jgi:threonine aldolase